MRSIRYGFDNRAVVGNTLDLRDKVTTCARNPKLRIVRASKPVCHFGGE